MTHASVPTVDRANDDSSSSWSDPAILSAKLREVAVGSHRVMTARPADQIERLRELRRRVERLQRKVRKHRMLALSIYVDALGARIDDQLGRDRERVETAE